MASRWAASGMWLEMRSMAAARTSRIVAGEGQTLLPPRLTGADGRYDQTVFGNDALELAGVHQFWIPHGQFDTVVTPGCDLGDIRLEITLECHRLEGGGVGRQHYAEVHMMCWPICGSW